MRYITRIGGAVLLLAVTACNAPPPSYYQGYAEGEFVRVALPFAGRLERLHVARGEGIAAGAALFVLESENEAAARREAEERLKNAEAQLANLRKGRRPTEIAALEAQLAQAKTALAYSESQFKRAEDLVAQNFISKERLDEARAARDRDRARIAELRADLATARLAARPDEIRAAEAAAEAARANLEQADWRLKQKTASAPVAGRVADTFFVNGEWVAAGVPVVSLLPPENIKVRFFVPEPGLGGLRTGQKVRVTCDGCAAPIAGDISFIAPQAEFTPPVIYSRESRAKLMFLIEARMQPQDAVKLHPGQPVEVRLVP
jgi:HlyD family secretion protein